MNMEQAYAQALWKIVEGGKTPHQAVHALHEMLKRDGREALLPRIASAFERIAQRAARKDDIVLTVAREKDLAEAKRKAKEVLSSLGIDLGDLPAGKAGLKTQVDDSLIGGWRLEGKEHLVDASYKQQLLNIFNSAISA